MPREQRKGEEPVRDAAADEAREREERSAAGEEDPREEEGWSQPESSAQKGTPEES